MDESQPPADHAVDTHGVERTLIVLRHAKSDWGTGVADHERPLNARGMRDAPMTGRELVRLGIPIDRVLCSSAIRTRQTWEGAQRGGANASEVTFHDEIYEAHPGRILDLVQALDDEVHCALVIGHYPGVARLVEGLAEHDSHPGWTRMAEKYPTSALAVLRFTGSWSQLRPGAATLVDYEVPRG